ncbi:SDR family oxidoreductase [Candidatus Roizmanbacteria bacterium]|nr:SDR family oxidoreductase [Candidatus Roizmanbacteria bacterium]
MQEKIKIFGIGISGLVGSRIVELLKDKYIFNNLSLDTGVDITNPETLDIIRKDQEHPIVLHLAALADVDGCERDKDLGEESMAYKINVGGTQNVIDACKNTNKKIIYISTDFVFDGENTPERGYTEEDMPNPINWYAKTKLLGEEAVKNSGLSSLIVRIAYPFQQKEFELKKDFVHAILGRLQSGQVVKAVTDHVMTPTFIDDLATGIDVLIAKNETGISHVVGDSFVTPFEAAQKIADTFGFDKSLIQKTTRAEYFQGRAPRPFNLSMNNAKIKKLGVKMKTFEDGLKILL